MGWGLAWVDGMGFSICRGDVGFMAGGRDVWAGRLMEWWEGGFILGNLMVSRLCILKIETADERG